MTTQDPAPGRDTDLLNRIAEVIRAVEPGARVVLHGSRARGEAEPESDWDLVVLVDGPVDPARTAAIRHRLYALERETNTILSSIVRSKQDWESSLYRAIPFHENVEREGVEL